MEETIPEQDAVHAQQVREEQVREAARAARATQAMEQYDSDLELPQALPALDSTIPKAELKKLKVKEKKRQEVINGLLTLFNLSRYKFICYRAVLHGTNARPHSQNHA